MSSNEGRLVLQRILEGIAFPANDDEEGIDRLRKHMHVYGA